jgi:origin recognition complex subunit 3
LSKYQTSHELKGAVLPVKRKPVTSLSNYDIELLKVWHGVLRDASGRSYVGPWNGYDIDISEGEPPPQLVVFLHEFEQFDEAVVQDLFYICRQARISSINDAA